MGSMAIPPKGVDLGKWHANRPGANKCGNSSNRIGNCLSQGMVRPPQGADLGKWHANRPGA